MAQFILILQLYKGDVTDISKAIKAKFSASEKAPAKLNPTDGKASATPGPHANYRMPEGSFYISKLSDYSDAYKLSESVVTTVEEAGGIVDRLFVAALDAGTPEYYSYDRNGSPSAMDVPFR